MTFQKISSTIRDIEATSTKGRKNMLGLIKQVFKSIVDSEEPDTAPFYVTDSCEYCGKIQGGYINGDLDSYVNIRNGDKCNGCGIPEKLIDD